MLTIKVTHSADTKVDIGDTFSITPHLKYVVQYIGERETKNNVAYTTVFVIFEISMIGESDVSWTSAK